MKLFLGFVLIGGAGAIVFLIAQDVYNRSRVHAALTATAQSLPG